MLSLIGSDPQPRCLTRKYKEAIKGRIFSLTPLKKEPHSIIKFNALLPRDIFESYCFLRKEYGFNAIQVMTHGIIDLCQQWDSVTKRTKRSTSLNMIQCRRLIKHSERIVNTTRNGKPFKYKVRAETQYFIFQEDVKASKIGAHEDDIVTIVRISPIAHRRTGYVDVEYYLRAISQKKSAKIPASRISKTLLKNYGIEDSAKASLELHKELIKSGQKVSYTDYESESSSLHLGAKGDSL